MRISSCVAATSLILLSALGVAPALAFDGTASPDVAAVPVAATPATSTTPALPKAISSGNVLSATATPALPNTSLSSLQYSADEGHPVAQWKLGQMYAAGDGVKRNDMMAFDYFSKIANQHADDNPTAPQAQIVANAFVALGRYYLEGIPNTRITPDPDRARQMFTYAASYFGNADAQYNLARLYLDTLATAPDPNQRRREAVRWLGLAAQKGHHQAQATLGQMMFSGDKMPRQAARGLMWLTLARDGAAVNETWINELYSNALRRASEDDRAMAAQMLQQWVQGRRD